MEVRVALTCNTIQYVVTYAYTTFAHTVQSSSEPRAEPSVGESAVAVFRAQVAPVVLRPGLGLDALGQSLPHALGLALGLRRPASPSSSSTSSCSNRRCGTPDSLLESGYRSDSSTQLNAASASAPALSFTFDELALVKLLQQPQPQVKLEPGLSPSRCAKDEPVAFKYAPDAGVELDPRLGPELDLFQEFLGPNWAFTDSIDLSLSSHDSLLEPSVPSTPTLENSAGGERSRVPLTAHPTGNNSGERDEALMNSSFDLDDLPLPDVPLPVPLIGLQVAEQLVQQLSVAQLVTAPASSRHALGCSQLSDAAGALEDSDEEFDMFLQSNPIASSHASNSARL